MNKQNEVYDILKNKEIDALVITDPYNLRYFSGFTGEEACYYISKKRCALITDSRYTLWAMAECAQGEVFTTNDAYGLVAQYVKEDGVLRMGFEGANLSYVDYNRLVEKTGIKDVVTVDNELAVLRMVKSKDEIQKIAAAEAIGDDAFEYILGILGVGMTEKDVALELEMFMKRKGADKLSFDVIAASGPNSAKPHAIPSDRKLQKGDFLTMDFGCIYEGYCSDMTRTVVIGTADERQKKIYNIVLDANLAVINGVRAGMTGKAGDAIARKIISEAGYGKNFGHGTGHSVGLYIHEEPRLGMRETRTLLPGMVLTVEPGIYIEGFGGVRIEDVVVIEENGVRNITFSPKELIEI